MTVCYDQDCAPTDIDVRCANETSASVGFSSGWSVYEEVDEDGKVTREIAFKGDLRDNAKLTCQKDGATVDCLTGR